MDWQRHRFLFWARQSGLNHNGWSHHGDGHFYSEYHTYSNPDGNIYSDSYSNCYSYSNANGNIYSHSDRNGYIHSHFYRNGYIHSNSDSDCHSYIYSNSNTNVDSNANSDAKSSCALCRLGNVRC